MADDVEVSSAASYNVSADEVTGSSPSKHVQRVKLAYSADGAETHVPADADGLKVNGSGVTQPVSGTVTANIGTVATLATAAKQDTGNASLASIDGKITAVNTGAVVVSSSALPSGASTSAKQDTEIASLASIDGKITAVNTGAVVVSSSALPTGASTLAEQQSQTTHLSNAAASLGVLDDWDETDRCKVNPIAGQAGVQSNYGTVTALTQRVVLATDVALSAGTNAIGKLSANSGVDIGDVDVTSAVSSDFEHGSNRDLDAAAEQLPTYACKFGVTVKAARANTASIYVGKSDVTADSTDATDGFELGPGESIFLPVNNANLVYAIGGAANQKFFWVAA